MKKTIKFLSIALFAGALFMSCEGPEGPAGLDGDDGVDGNLTCLECHSTVVMDAITEAFDMTKHFEGESWARGNSASCGRCHSHDGFVEFVRSGNAIAATISTSMQCATCHDSHSSLEGDITAPIKEVSEVIAIVDPTRTFEHGKGNLCATCHQARTNGTAYDKYTTAQTLTVTLIAAKGDDVAFYNDPANCDFGPGTVTRLINGTNDTLKITFDVPTTHVYTSSIHAGPHHGPQANMFAGIVGYPTDGVAFDRAGHTDCVSCHLNDTTAAGGFGHAFTPDVNQCNTCHGTAVDVEGIMADNHTRLDAIVEKLAELQMVAIDGTAPYTVDEVSPLLSVKTREEFIAFYNAMCILEDKSAGIHNVDYTNQMLDKAETNLGLK